MRAAMVTLGVFTHRIVTNYVNTKFVKADGTPQVPPMVTDIGVPILTYFALKQTRIANKFKYANEVLIGMTASATLKVAKNLLGTTPWAQYLGEGGDILYLPQAGYMSTDRQTLSGYTVDGLGWNPQWGVQGDLGASIQPPDWVLGDMGDAGEGVDSW